MRVTIRLWLYVEPQPGILEFHGSHSHTAEMHYGLHGKWSKKHMLNFEESSCYYYDLDNCRYMYV